MLSTPFSIPAFAHSSHISIPSRISIPPNISIPPYLHFLPYLHSPPYPHSRESGNLPINWCGAGNARAASLCNLRRWRGNREIPAFAGMGSSFNFVVHPLFYSRFRPFPPHPHSSHIPIPPTSPFPHIFISSHISIPPHIPIPAKAGISRLTGAGRATLAPHRFVICADGAGIGRFPLSREWNKRAGMECFFLQNKIQ